MDIYLFLTAFLSLFTKQDQAPEDASTHNTPIASPNFQTHEPSSVIFISQQSGMAKKPLTQIIPPRKEKAAVGHVSIPMPIDEPSEFLVRSSSTHGEPSISTIPKGVSINAPIQEENQSKYQVVINQIIRNLREQELGKVVLGYAIPVTGLLILFTNDIFSPLLPIIIIALCVGLVCLLNGLLFRGTVLDKLACRLELFGAVCVLFAFFSVVGSFLPPYLAWIVWVCFLTLLLPLTLSFCHVKEMTLTKGNSPI